MDERLGFLGPAVTSLALIDILGLHLRSPGLPAVPLGFSNVHLLFVRNHPPRASCHRTRLPHHLALTGRVLAWFPRFPALASTVGLAARRPRPAERGSLDSRMPRPVLSALRARRSPRLPRPLLRPPAPDGRCDTSQSPSSLPVVTCGLTPRVAGLSMTGILIFLFPLRSLRKGQSHRSNDEGTASLCTEVQQVLLTVISSDRVSIR